MTTEKDLSDTIHTASNHLRPGGVLLIITHTQEEFKENNFVYAGSKGDVEITIFENNHITNVTRSVYEVTLTYLIRKNGELQIHHDCHKIGLFKLETWLKLFNQAGLLVKIDRLDHSYDRFIMGEDGQYPQTTFIGIKSIPNINKKF